MYVERTKRRTPWCVKFASIPAGKAEAITCAHRVRVRNVTRGRFSRGLRLQCPLERFRAVYGSRGEHYDDETHIRL